MSDDDLKFEHLSEREMLILVCRDMREVKSTTSGHHERLTSLERWQTRLTAAWGTVTVLGGLIVGYLESGSHRGHQ